MAGWAPGGARPVLAAATCGHRVVTGGVYPGTGTPVPSRPRPAGLGQSGTVMTSASASASTSVMTSYLPDTVSHAQSSK